jgi:hypothetical protein
MESAMTDDDKYKPLHEWHDEIMPEPFDTILECLGENGIKFLEFTIRPNGLRIVELVDEYQGRTLTKNQLDRLIAELTAISEKLGKQSE